MHQGHVPPSTTGPPGYSAPAQSNGHAAQNSIPGLEQSVDDLIASAGRPTEAAKPAESQHPKKEEESSKAKKEDDKRKLVYSDNGVSPEEKMAKLARYAFNPAERKKDETVVGSLEPPVSGVVVGQDDVVDPSG